MTDKSSQTIIDNRPDTTMYPNVLLFSVALFISLWDLHKSGEIWLDDGARYCNNGAMVSDFIYSGRWTSPITFATENYVQYPAHSIPYHPPAYPVLLGIWFSVFGVSYAASRVFTGIMLGISIVFFRKILMIQGVPKWPSLLGGLLLATLPEVITWSRTAMSEIPGLGFGLASIYFFIRHEKHQQLSDLSLCFLAAEIAFLSRIQTAGLLPGMFLFAAYASGWRRLLDKRLVTFTASYITMNIIWIKFASQFSSLEMRTKLLSLERILSVENWSQWILSLPNMTGSLLLLWTVIGMLRQAKARSFGAISQPAILFSLLALSVYLFEGIRGSHFESRYFIYALPWICGIATLGLYSCWQTRLPLIRALVVLSVFGIFALSSKFIISHPSGLVGYDRVGSSLAMLSRTGNILVSVPWDSDLIFHYRCKDKQRNRQILRGDRVLAIRFGDYADEPTTTICNSTQEVLEKIKMGGIRYVVSSYPSADSPDNRPSEMRLCHQTMLTHASEFQLVSQHNIEFGQYDYKIYVWQIESEQPLDINLIPVEIPTAGLSIGLNQ